jgi:chromosome segregation ATPase
MRKALKDSEEKIEARDCHLELVEREMEMLREQVRRKEHLEEELGHSLAEQIRMNEEKEAELRNSNALLSGALEQLKNEVDAFSFAFSQSKAAVEDTVSSVEQGVESQKREIEILKERLQEVETLLQDRDSFWQEQIWARVKELEDSNALKLESWRQTGDREQENAKRLFQQQQAVFTNRIASLERSSQDLQMKIDLDKMERESLIKEYEDALDELDANHQHVKCYCLTNFIQHGMLETDDKR